VGTLLGDPEVWDDSRPRPRIAVRAAVALAAGLAAGALVGFLVTPAPSARPVTDVVVPTTPAPPSVAIDADTLSNVTLAAGSMLVSKIGQIQTVKPDGTGGQAIASGATASAAVGPAPDGSLTVLDNGVVETFGKSGARPRRLTPASFTAAGLAGRVDGKRVLACGGPSPRGQAPPGPGSGASSLLLPRGGGRAETVQLGCPVAWATSADRIAGTGGPRVRFRDEFRGSSVLAGPAGGPLRPVLRPERVRAVGGRGASVGALALSPDGRWLAAAVGAGNRGWTVLIEPLAGGREARVPLAAGYEAAWIGWKQGQSGMVLAIAAVDRRGDLGKVPLDARHGDGYVLLFDLSGRTARVMISGPPMVQADGFAWSANNQAFGISSPLGWTVVLDVGSTSITPSPVKGRLVSWPGGDR
jgi:hypothetical protein